MAYDPTFAARLQAAVSAASPGADVSVGRRDDRSTWRVQHPEGATQQQRDAAAAALEAFDATPLDAVAVARLRAAAALDDASMPLTRAVVLVTVDELNALRQWVQSFRSAVAAATSLADLKARVAALASLPDRTAAQARAAVRGRLAAGDADA